MASINIQDLLNKTNKTKPINTRTASINESKLNLDLESQVLEAEENEIDNTNISLIEDLVINLLQARLILHICHLRVNGPGSFAKHLALGEAYELSSDFADKIAETTQGNSKSLLNLSKKFTIEVPAIGNECAYLDQLLATITEAIPTLDQGGDLICSNILQDLAGSLRQIIYKLTFLE